MGAEPFKMGPPHPELQPQYYSSVPEMHHKKVQPVQKQAALVPWCCCVGYWCSLTAWSVLYFTCRGTSAIRLLSLNDPPHSHSGFGFLSWCQSVGWMLLRMHWLSFYAPITLAPCECAVLVFLQLSVPVMCWLAPSSFVRRYRVRWIVAIRLASFCLHFTARALYLPTVAAPAREAAFKDEAKTNVSEPGPGKSTETECSFTKGITQGSVTSSNGSSSNAWRTATVLRMLAPVKLPRHLLMLEFILVAIDAVLHLSAGGLHASVFTNAGLFNLLYGVVLPGLLSFLPSAGSDTCRDSIYLLAADVAKRFVRLMRSKLLELEGSLSPSWANLVSWSQATLEQNAPNSTASASAVNASASSSSGQASALSSSTHTDPTTLPPPSANTHPPSETKHSSHAPLRDMSAGRSSLEQDMSYGGGGSGSSTFGKQSMWSYNDGYSGAASGSSATPSASYQEERNACSYLSSGRCMPGTIDPECAGACSSSGKSGLETPDGPMLESPQVGMFAGVHGHYRSPSLLNDGSLGLPYQHTAKSGVDATDFMECDGAAMSYDDLTDDSTCAALPLELQQLMEKWQTLPAMDVEPLYTSCVKRTTLAVKVGHSVDEEKAMHTLGSLDDEDTFMQVAAELSNNVVSALHSTLDADSLYLSTICVRGCVQLVVHASIPLSSLSKVAEYGGWEGVIDSQILVEQVQQALWSGLGKNNKLGGVVMSADGRTVVYQQAAEAEASSMELSAEVVPQPVSCSFSLQAIHPMCIASKQECILEVHLAVQGQGVGTSMMARAVLLNQGLKINECDLKLSMHESGRFCFGWVKVPPVRYGAVELWILGHDPQEAGKVYAMALLPVLSSSGAEELQTFITNYPDHKRGKGAPGSSQGSGSKVPKAKMAGGESESEEWHCFGELAHDLALLLMHACGGQPSAESNIHHLHLLTPHDIAALLQKLLCWLLSHGLLLTTRDCMYTCYKFQSLQKLLRQAGTDLVKLADDAMAATTYGMQVGAEKSLQKSAAHLGRSTDDNAPFATRCRRWLYSNCTWRTAALSMELSICMLRWIQLFYPSLTHSAMLSSYTAPFGWKLVAMGIQVCMLVVMYGNQAGMGDWRQRRCQLMLLLEVAFSWIVLTYLLEPQCELEVVENWLTPFTVSWAPRALHACLFVVVHLPRFGRLALPAIVAKVLLGFYATKSMCGGSVLPDVTVAVAAAARGPA